MDNFLQIKKLPLGIQNFRKIIEENCVYVDKTKYIYELINNASYYFLSRPRRFGKSLLIDTISEVFKGSRELFKGLWIYDSDYDFTEYPVIKLDMSGISNHTPDILKKSLSMELLKRITEEGFDIDGDIPADMFKRLIECLYKKYGRRAVVLIDEYDKPILDHLENPAEAEANRAVMRGFYGVLKSLDPYLKFTFITGVSKFTKTSVFSGLNNLFDITMTKKYSSICGIEIENLGKYFGPHIGQFSSVEGFGSYDDIYKTILEWYDGYSWDGKTRVINPFALLTFFMQEKFESYWYVSGSPKFLADMIKTRPESYLNLNKFEMSEGMLDSADIGGLGLEPLLFQTGYLTVTEIFSATKSPVYLLGIPNHEVREALNLQILSTLTDDKNSGAWKAREGIERALKNNDLRQMLDILRGLYASIPYEIHIRREAYYHSIFYAVMNVLGFDIEAEVSVAEGRIDAVLELGDAVYIMEFKYKECPAEANAEEKNKIFDAVLSKGMEQIKNMGYHKKYTGSRKKIYMAAFAFLGRDEIEMRTEIIN